MQSGLSETLNKATVGAKKIKDFILAQDLNKIVFVGSAIVLFGVVAYGFLFRDDKEDPKDSQQSKGGDQLKGQDGVKPKRSVSAKRKFTLDRKFANKDDPYSEEDVSTSYPNENRSVSHNKTGRGKGAIRFMSEGEGYDSRTPSSGDSESKEEADDLYFAMMNKLTK